MKFDLVIAMVVMVVVHVPRLADGVPIDIHPERRVAGPGPMGYNPGPSAPAPTNSTVTCAALEQFECTGSCEWGNPPLGGPPECRDVSVGSTSPCATTVMADCTSHPGVCIWDTITTSCASVPTPPPTPPTTGSGSGSAAPTPPPSFAPVPTPPPTLACSGREQHQCVAKDSCVWDRESTSCGTLSGTYTPGTYRPVPALSSHSSGDYSMCRFTSSDWAPSGYYYTYVSEYAQTCVDESKWPSINQEDFCGHILGNTPRPTECGASEAQYKAGLAEGFEIMDCSSATNENQCKDECVWNSNRCIMHVNIKSACKAWGNAYGAMNLQAKICLKCMQDGVCAASSAATTPTTPTPTPLPDYQLFGGSAMSESSKTRVGRTTLPRSSLTPSSTGSISYDLKDTLKKLRQEVKTNEADKPAAKRVIANLVKEALVDVAELDYILVESEDYDHPRKATKPSTKVYPPNKEVRLSNLLNNETFTALTDEINDFVRVYPYSETHANSAQYLQVTKTSGTTWKVEGGNTLTFYDNADPTTLVSELVNVLEGVHVCVPGVRCGSIGSFTDEGVPCPTSIDLTAAVSYNKEKDDSLFAQTGVVGGTIVPATYTLQSITLDGAHTVDAGQRLPGFLRRETTITASVLSDSGDVVTGCPVTYNSLGDRSRGAIQEIWGTNRAVLDDHYGNTFSPHTLEIAVQACDKIDDSGEKTQLSSPKTEINTSCQRKASGDKACISHRMDDCSLRTITMDPDAQTSSNPLSTYCQLRNGNVGSDDKYTLKSKLYEVNSDDGNNGMTRGVLPRHSQALSDYAVYTHPTGDSQASSGVTAKSARAAQRQTGIIAIDDRLAAENRDLWIESQTKSVSINSVGGGYPTAYAKAFLGLQFQPTPAADPTMQIYQSVRISGNNSKTNVQHWAERAPTIHVKPSTSAFEGGSESSGCAQSAPVNFAVIDESVLADCHVIDDNGNPSVLTQIRESPAVNTEVHVCVSENDQETLLSPDDRFENIVNYFNKGEIRFETSDGESYPTTHPRIVTNSSSSDNQICFVMKNLAEPPRCSCGSTACSSSTDLFQSRIATDDPNNAVNLRTMAAPTAYACDNQPVSSRVYTASVENSMNAYVGLDGDLESLIAGTVDATNPDNAAACAYSQSIRDLVALKVKSNKHLRIRAAAGLQKQIAVRIGVYQTYGKLNLDGDGGSVLELSAGTYDRVSVRSALTMVAFQPYATGVCGNTACGSLTDFIGNAALPSYVADHQVGSKQSSIQQIPDITAVDQYGTNDAVFKNSLVALDFNSKLGDDQGGCMAWERTKTATDTLRLAETTRIDFRIKETTTCSYKGVRVGDQKNQSKEERHWFGADCASENEIAQARVVRAMFSSNYDDVTFDLSLYEYGCDTMEHHYYIDGTTMESLEARRVAKGETWTEVVNAVIKNLKIKFPYDYSTHACGDLTFEAFVGVQDVRSCGHENYALQDSTEFAKFTISTRSKDDAEYNSDKAMQINFNAQLTGGNLPSEVHVQHIQGTQSQLKQKYLTMYYSDTTTKSVTSDTPCNQNHVWTIGDSSDSASAQYPRSTVASTVSRDAGILGYNVNTRWDQSRDHDYQASLEITDFTDIVSLHDYHTGAGACDYDSDILALVKQTDQDDIVEAWTHRPEIDRLLDAAFVLPHCFTLSGTDSSTAETSASDKDRGFAYQMIHGSTVAAGDCTNGDTGRTFGAYGNTCASIGSAWNGDCAAAASEGEESDIETACPCTCGSGLSDVRKFRRYSIFASVDAFAIASGLDLDVQQGCVPCSTILDKADDQPFFNDNSNAAEFVAQCVRSRESMHGVVDAEGCPTTVANSRDYGLKLARSSLSLLSNQFPAFVTRPGSRDPHRVSVSLDIYDWMNRYTQHAASVGSVEVTRSGLQFFTVVPQCSGLIGNVTAVPFHDDDFKCKIEWNDLSHSGDHIEYAENANTGDDLKFKIPVQTSSKSYVSNVPDGIAKVHQNAIQTVKTFESGAGATENFNWGSTDGSQEYVFVKNTLCAPGKVCLTPCDKSEPNCIKVGGSPVNKNRETYTRVSLARVLTNLHHAHAAQSESLTDSNTVDRCAQRSWTQLGVNSSLSQVDTLDDSLIDDALKLGGSEGLLTLNNLNSVLHKHLKTGQMGVYGNSSQQHIDQCQRRCTNGAGSGCGAPNVLQDYVLQSDTQFGTNYRDTSVFPSAIGDRTAYDRVGFGAFMNPDCDNLKGYTQSTLNSQPNHGNTYADTKNSNENFDLVLHFLNQYNSETRNMLSDTASANGCDKPDDFLSFGMQVAMTSESKTRSEYAGGSVIVSHCEVLPGASYNVADQDQSDDRQLFVKASLLDQDANNKSQQLRFPSEASVDISKTYWRDDADSNKVRMFEVDQYNIDDRTKAVNGEDHTNRKDTLALTVAFDFDSNDARYQDLRPVNFTMDITQADTDLQINDLFDAYIVLDDITDAGKVWTKEMTQSLTLGSNGEFDFDFKQVDSAHEARYMPVQRGISAESPGLDKSSCMYLMTVDDHNPTNDEPVKYRTEIVDVSTQWSDPRACHKIKIVPKTTNLGLDSIKVKTCAWVKDSGDNSIMVKDCTQKTVEVVNVAGQPLQCVLPHQINPHKVIRTVDPLSITDPADVVCAHVAGGEGEQLRSMQSGKFAVIAQSSLGRISSFVRLSVNVGSTSFSQRGDFNADGKINLNDQTSVYSSIGPTDTTQLIKEMYRIPCEYETTCKMYGERAYLNLVTDNDIQLARTINDISDPNVFKIHRYMPLSDDNATSTISEWANAPSSTGYSMGSLYGQFSVDDFVVESALDADPIDPAVESDYADSTGAKGGRMFRILMANTSVSCSGAGNTSCTVGYQIDGDKEQVDNLVYAAGSKIHADNHINFKMFVTTFTYEDDYGVGVISIDASGYPTRSGVVAWRAKVATMADIGGVCMRSAAISGDSAFDTSFFNSYDAKTMDELGENTPKMVIDELYAAEKDVNDNRAPYKVVGAPVVSTKDMEDGSSLTHYKNLTFKLSDSTFSSKVAATQAINVTFTRVVMTQSASDRFDSLSNYDLKPNSAINCASLNSKQLGLCVESGDNHGVVVKMGSERSNSEETLTVQVAKQTGVIDSDSDNHMMVCLGIHTVESMLFENNIVKQCQELCFVALDPDVRSTTDCDHTSGSCPGDVAAFEDQQKLADVQCNTTLSADHAKKLWTLKTVGIVDGGDSRVVQTSTASISLASISRTRESSLVSKDVADLILDTSSVTSSPVVDTDFGSTAFASIGFVNNTVDASLTGSVDTPVSGFGSITDSFDNGDVLIESRRTVIKLLSDQAVATDLDLTSGRRCMSIPQLDSSGYACPFTEVQTQNTKSNALCRKFRTEYATGDDEAGYTDAASNEDTACYGTMTDPQQDGCKKVGLKKIGILNSTITTLAGTRASGFDDQYNLKGLVMAGVYASCGGDYKTQMSSQPKTCVGQSAMAGVYTFSQSKLFKRSGVDCVHGSNVALELESHVTDAVEIEDALLDFGDSRQKLCLINGKTMIMPIDTVSCVNPIKLEDSTLKMTEVSNMCDLVSDLSVLRVNLKGKLGVNPVESRYITVVFANAASSGTIEIDANNTVVRPDDFRLGATAWEIPIKRTSAASDLTNMFGLSRFGVAQEGGGGVTIEDVWVVLKVCTENVISDSFGYQISHDTNHVQWEDMVPFSRSRLDSEKTSSTICAEDFVKISSDITHAHIMMDRTSNGCALTGDCQVFSASLCRDIEHMSDCIVIPDSALAHIEGEDDASARREYLMRYLQRTSDNIAHDYVPSPLLVSEWNSPYTLETDNRPIKCKPIDGVTNCGYRNVHGTCATTTDVHFDVESSSSNGYTTWLRSGMTGHYESHQNAKRTVTLDVSTPGKYCLAVTAEKVYADDESEWASSSCIVGNSTQLTNDVSKVQCAMSTETEDAISTLPTLNKFRCPSNSGRLACFDWTTGKKTVNVVALSELTESRIDYLHLFKECNGPTSCAKTSTDRFAIVVLPMQQDNFYGAHGLRSSSNSGMNFGNIRFTGNKIHIQYELGQYRPSRGTGCATEDEDNGVGYPVGKTEQDKRQCRDWGDTTARGAKDRGFSPKLCTLQIGEGQGLKYTTDDVFGKDYTRNDACSLSRGIGNVWVQAGANTQTSFAEALFTGKLNGIGDASVTRKSCDAVSPFVGDDVDSTPWDALYSPSTPMTYRSQHTATSTDPSYDMMVVESTNGTLCDSKLRVQGNIHVSLERARTCHHEDSNQNWVPIAKQEITNPNSQDEMVTVDFPVTMRCYSAAKPRGSGSEYIITEETVKTDVTVFTRTYSAGNTSTVKSTDLPAVYMHSTELITANGDTKIVGAKEVNSECYDDCVLSENAATPACQASCASSCQVLKESDGGDIPGLFGYLNINVNVESLHGTTDEHPFISGARAFRQVSGLEAVGSFNSKSVQVLSTESCTHKVSKPIGESAESTVSKLQIKTVVKRLLDIDKATWIEDGSVKRMVKNSGDLLPDKNAFNTGRSAGCTCGDNNMPILSPHSPHPKCTFKDGTDYAFQVQTRQCAESAVTGSEQCLVPSDATCSTAGSYRTVQMYLSYENTKQFVNKQEIEARMHDEVSQGAIFKSDSSTPTSLADADASSFVARSAVGDSDRLVQGESVFMTQEVLDGVSILGRSWQLHTQTALTAILSQECDVVDSDCASKGYLTGQCGANFTDLTGKYDYASKHIMSKVILPESTSNERTSEMVLKQLWRDTAYYKRVRERLATAPDSYANVKFGGGVSSDVDLCFTVRGGLDNALQINKNSAAAWCVSDHLKSIWDGSEAVTGFLETLREQTCDIKNRVLLCPFSSLASSTCFVLGTALDHSDDTLCMADPVNADGFKDHFRIMEIVREYEYQSNKVALENFVPGPTVDSVCSDQVTEPDVTNKYQVAFGEPGLVQCAQMDRAVHASFRSKVQGLVSASQYSDSLIAGDARKGQCLGRAKSDRLTTNALAGEYTIKDRSPMRQHLHFGASFIIPCVPRIAYMESRVTDTRSTCGTAHIFEKNGKLKVKRSLPVSYSADTLVADAEQEYDLYYDLSSSCNVNTGVCSDLTATDASKSPVYMPPVSKVCGNNGEDSIAMEVVEEYKDLLQWSHGVLTYWDGAKHRPVFISSASGAPSGFTDVPASVCSGAVATRRSAAGVGRRMLTVKTASSGASKTQEVELRRSSDEATNDISIVTTVSLAAGSHQVATCINMNTCAGYYTPKSNADSLQCTDNVDGQCSLSYCCDLVGVTHVTVRADCTSLGSSHTQLKMMYVAAMTIAFFALILILGHMAAVRIKQFRCSNVIERQRLCEKPTIVVALEIVTVTMFLISAIVGLIGQGEDAWINTCGLENNAGWNAWVPLLLALLVGGYYGRQYYVNRGGQCDAASARPDIFSAGEAQL